MDNISIINQRVEVAAIFRSTINNHTPCFPAKMKYKNRLIEFSELGFRHPVPRGKKIIHVFEMSDGTDDYRLEFDAESLMWTLVAITPGQI